MVSETFKIVLYVVKNDKFAITGYLVLSEFKSIMK